MSNITMNIHSVTNVEIKPISVLIPADGEEYQHNQNTQAIVITTEDGDKSTFTAFFADAVNERIDRERDTVNNTVVGQLR